MATSLLSPALMSAFYQQNALRNLIPYSEDVTQWVNVGTTVTGPLNLNALGWFTGYEIASNGADWHSQIIVSLPAAEDEVFSAKLLLRKGTSQAVRFTVRYSDMITTSQSLYGSLGSLPESSGSITLVSEMLREDGLTYEIVLRITSPRATTLLLRVGPDSDVVGENIVMLAAQVERGEKATTYQKTP